MTPAARLQAAIELLDEIIIAARDNGPSADNLIKKFFRARRYAGSKDRRAIRELCYEAIRLCGERPFSGRAAMIALAEVRPELTANFDGSSYGPAPLEPSEEKAGAASFPNWLQHRFAELIDEQEIAALLDRAPLDIRWNAKAKGESKLKAEWPEIKELCLPHSYRLPGGTPIEDSMPYRNGQIEVQDLGSQAIAAACLLGEPTLVLDLCAGAGGKTLALAAGLEDTARIIATDTDRNRIRKLIPRVNRAGFANISERLLDPGREKDVLADLSGKCDLVLVDAPCSGTGTWRRNPELRWRMTQDRLKRTTVLQSRLLELGGEMVKPGGRLVYAVCSLLEAEGGQQITDFLSRDGGWRHIEVDLPLGRPYRKGIVLSPYQDGTDGFYFSCLEKL